MSVSEQILPLPALEVQENYLNASYSLRSWLLTTDHKRICILYMISITFFFALGGIAATMIRLELLSPTGKMVSDDTYNKLFTIHGVIMVWLFLIPSIPTTLGNFLIPMMIGARDVAFPKLNLLSWYLFMIGGTLVLLMLIFGGVDTGLDLLRPALHEQVAHLRNPYGSRRFCRGLRVDPDRSEFRRYHPHHALSGNDLASAAAVYLVAICHQHCPGAGHAGVGDHADADCGGTHFPCGHFRPGAWRRSGAVRAPVLVLLAPGRVHHDSAVVRGGLGSDHLLFAQNIFGYAFVAYASISIAPIGFLVWGHHMFVSGQSTYAGITFSFLSFLVAVPSAIKVFNWTATLYKGFDYISNTDAVHCLGFIGLFTVGGLTGLFLASLAVDVHLTHTYFIVAHFHYIMVGGAVMAYMGGIHFLVPENVRACIQSGSASLRP